MASLTDQIHNRPMFLPLLKIIQFQSYGFVLS